MQYLMCRIGMRVVMGVLGRHKICRIMQGILLGSSLSAMSASD